jgi:hypothetical protein
MRIPILSDVVSSLQALFPLPHVPDVLHNFYVLRNSFSFSVWRPSNRDLLSQRAEVIKFYLAQEYNWNDYDTIVNGYRISEVSNEAVTADVIRGNLPDHQVPRDDHYWNSLCKVTQTFAPSKPVQPVHFNDLRLYPWTKSTNVEAPFSHEKRYQRYKQAIFDMGLIPNLKNTFFNFQDLVFNVCAQQIHVIKNGNAFNPSKGGSEDGFFHYFTTHAKTALVKSDDPDKIRMVFGAPKLFLFAEAMFFWPLFSFYMNRSGPFPILWNYPILSGGWLRLNAEFQHRHYLASVLMLDFKQFDKRALFSVIKDIEDGWLTYFDLDHGYQPTSINTRSYANPKRLLHLWDWCCHARKHIPILLPDGRVLARLFRGVPSGAFTTQFLDSIYVGLMVCTGLSALGIDIDIWTMLKLMGDDSLARIPIFVPPSQHADFMAALSLKFLFYFDAILNVTKSKMSNRIEGAEVLSYENRNGLPYRDELEIAARLLHTKSRAPKPEHTMAQCIGLATALADPETRFYRTAHNVFTHYSKLGFKPEAPEVHKDEHLYGYSLPTHSFPSPSDVISRLLSPSRRPPDIAETYWPSWFFLNNP